MVGVVGSSPIAPTSVLFDTLRRILWRFVFVEFPLRWPLVSAMEEERMPKVTLADGKVISRKDITYTQPARSGYH
jgi:hypothetical protein